MKLLVTQCNLIDAIGIWEVDSYSALIPKIERTLGHKDSRIDYTANLLHSLTSYL